MGIVQRPDKPEWYPHNAEVNRQNKNKNKNKTTNRAKQTGTGTGTGTGTDAGTSVVTTRDPPLRPGRTLKQQQQQHHANELNDIGLAMTLTDINMKAGVAASKGKGFFMNI